MSAVPFKLCQLHLDDSCQLSAVHAHEITHYMKNMIGITSTMVRGQNIYVIYAPDEASACQVKNYLCAAVCLFESKWRNAIQRAFHHRYGENEVAASRERRQSALKNQPVFKAGRSARLAAESTIQLNN